MLHTALVLFDIDGTLVRKAGPHHARALSEGVRAVTGLTVTTEGIPLHGMLDSVILRRMLHKAGIPKTLDCAAIYAAAEEYYLRTCPPIEDKLCPGVVAALERLERRGALLALVTGNLTRIGWHKLKQAGIGHHFQFGAFGEMASTRAALARWAIRHARGSGWIEREAPVTLIGDAPADIQAAKANRVCSIAVRTGIAPAASLEAAEPDHLLSSLHGLRLYMAGIGARRLR
jgi:phosphoglycolate phosphatase